MISKLARPIIAALALSAAGCDRPGAPANETAAGEPSSPAANVLKSETVEALFTGWEVGDYVWANFKVEGREAEGAWVGPSPLEHFLEAHKGQPVTLRIETTRVHVPEAGGEQEVRRIVAASAGGVDAGRWWAGLSAEQRQAAERGMEEVLGGGA